MEKLSSGQKAICSIEIRSFEELSLKIELVNEKQPWF